MPNRIKQLRQEANLTQRELADKLGLTPKAISFYELGQRQIPNGILLEMAVIFSATPGYILGASEERVPPIANKDISELVELFKKLSPSDQAMLMTLAGRMANK